MISRLLSNWFLDGLFDFALLAGTGVGVWWLVDLAVPAEWCAGGRWDAVFLFALLPLFFARFMKPPQGRVRWMQGALLAACAAVATSAAVMAGRLIAGCTDVEGRVGGLVVLPHFAAGMGIGLIAATAWFLLAARLPAVEGEGAETYPDGAGRAFVAVAAISSGILFVIAWPELVDAAATALLGGYCPNSGPSNILYILILILLGRALSDGGRPAYRAVALTGLAAIAIMSTADILAGLAITCPPAGEDHPIGLRLLRGVIKGVGFGFAAVPLLRLSAKYQREAGSRSKNPHDEEAAR